MRIYLNEAGKCPNNATNSAKNHAILLVVLTGHYLAHFHKWTDTFYIVFWGLTVLNHASAENDSIPRWEEKWLVKEQYENFLSKWDNSEEWESYQVPPYCLLGVVISTECVKRRRTEGWDSLRLFPWHKPVLNRYQNLTYGLNYIRSRFIFFSVHKQGRSP